MSSESVPMKLVERAARQQARVGDSVVVRMGAARWLALHVTEGALINLAHGEEAVARRRAEVKAQATGGKVVELRLESLREINP